MNMCGTCCYENKQAVDFASIVTGECSDCGKDASVYVLSEAVLLAQERSRAHHDYYAYLHNVISSAKGVTQ